MRRRSSPAFRSPSRPRWSRLGNRARRTTMANIGTFTKTEQGFTGELVTLSLKAKNVRLVEEAASSNENAPTHWAFVGRVEIGAAWAKRSNEGRPYLSVKLDDPSFTGPIYANLIEDEDGMTHPLIWSPPAARPSGDCPAQNVPRPAGPGGPLPIPPIGPPRWMGLSP